MRMIIRYLKRSETLDYECEKSSDFWKNNIKEAIEHFNLENKELIIHVSYLYSPKTGYTKYYFLQTL